MLKYTKNILEIYKSISKLIIQTQCLYSCNAVNSQHTRRPVHTIENIIYMYTMLTFLNLDSTKPILCAVTYMCHRKN